MSVRQDSIQPDVGERQVEDLFESKLHPPSIRGAVVSRTALVDRLDAANDVPITAVVAPPGYGKTTLLAKWAQRCPSRVAWLSLDRHDNDLARLESYIAAALNRIDPSFSEVLRPASRPRSAVAVASRVAGVLSEMEERVVLVLDHVESLDDEQCLDAITELALHLPTGSRLVLASRVEPPLPMARLRVGGDVLDIGVDDLAMSPPEARTLFEAAGVRLDDADLDEVLDRTEGWPVGLYLAALAMKAGGSRQHAGVPFSGDDRLMAEYLRTELLSHLSDAEVSFLTRTAVLDRMCAPLCDAVLDSSGSDAVLESLVHSNHLLVALDRRGEWYRYHHLFRDLLRVELHRRDRALVTALHLRAAEWWEAHRFPELAIDHAQAAGDAERVNRLMLLNGQKAYAAGRAETLARWLAWFEHEDLVEKYPAVAVVGALFYTAAGNPDAAERWAVAAEHPSPALRSDERTGAQIGAPERILPDGSTLGAWRAFLRALQCRDGSDAMRRDAEIALEGLSAASPYRTAAFGLKGISILLGGDFDGADRIFAKAIESHRVAPAGPGALIAVAERGFCALHHDDWQAVQSFVDDALLIVQQSGLGSYTESALAYALAARAALHRGEVEAARDYVTRTVAVRPLLTYARAAVSAQTLLEVARTYVALEDPAGAREVLRQTRAILQKRPDLGLLPKWVDELDSKLDAMHTGKVGVSSLTPAELRLVPYFPTHLTYAQIAARLCVSVSTAKSHGVSIYQKLGVSSRGEAVERLREIGLLAT